MPKGGGGGMYSGGEGMYGDVYGGTMDVDGQGGLDMDEGEHDTIPNLVAKKAYALTFVRSEPCTKPRPALSAPPKLPTLSHRR